MKATREQAREVVRGGEDTELPVSRKLVVTAAWAWRMLVIAAAVYVAVRVLVILALAVLPFVAALLLTALLWPVTIFLRRHMPDALATWLTLILGVAVLGGLGYFIGVQIAAAYPQLVDQLIQTVRQLRDLLAQTPLAIPPNLLNNIEDTVTTWLQQNASQLASLVVTSVQYVVKVGAGLALTVFITFFLLDQGERIWGWLVSRFRYRTARRVDRAGRTAWETITGYVHGTVVIATIHGVVIGLTLFFLGVPLVVPLAVLVFLGSFIPIVGALVAGGIAVLVTLVTGGFIDAAILLAVLIVENQLEGNLLQPLIMGRQVRLHPLVIGLVLTVGAVLAGIVGAIVAVPATAVVYRAWRALMGPDEEAAEEPGRPPGERVGPGVQV